MPRVLAAGLTAVSAAWLAALLTVGLWPDVPPVLSAVVHAAGSRVCHQRPDRSFHPRDGRPLGVCARCTGLYLAGTAGALSGWLGLAAVPRRSKAWLAAAALPTLVTLGLEWAGIAAPSNMVRAAAALPLGGAAGWLFVRMLRAESAGAHAL
jgi:uncharacterized membrane protein